MNTREAIKIAIEFDYDFVEPCLNGEMSGCGDSSKIQEFRKALGRLIYHAQTTRWRDLEDNGPWVGEVVWSYGTEGYRLVETTEDDYRDYHSGDKVEGITEWMSLPPANGDENEYS